MKSNCLIEAWRIYRALARDDQPGARSWLAVTRSWTPGVPLHAGVMRPVPGTGHFELIHFQPASTRRRPWWLQWRLRGFIKHGDWAETEVLDKSRW